MFELDLKSRKSIYQQVVDNLKHQIISGVLKAEEKLPSVRELSHILTVNPNTIQKAYRELEHQGFVYTASGLGTFVSHRENIKPDEGMLNEIYEKIRKELSELYYIGEPLLNVRKKLGKLIEEREDWK